MILKKNNGVIATEQGVNNAAMVAIKRTIRHGNGHWLEQNAISQFILDWTTPCTDKKLTKLSTGCISSPYLVNDNSVQLSYLHMLIITPKYVNHTKIIIHLILHTYLRIELGGCLSI